MGRPSKYETHVAPRLEEISDWVRNGATDEEIAKRLGVSRDSFYQYKREFSDFSDTLKRGKEYVDGQVENALLRRALGYSYEEITKEDYGEGLKITKVVTKQVVPDTTAQIFWLKNRRPEQWKEKQIPVSGEADGTENYSANDLKEALMARKIEGIDEV